ncbi:hypothetical protein [Methylobacter sp. S3L5C]|uniref:hypothetical protein n=1 Tax=Methylobacter sp. S3L5C TaxID=2839024 RepID=UPI001FAD03A3|nr:hypothetical protein [Methylobacter sp. S3L5C]UOA08362.1 hypothetical protein KKZ03_19500 [Methylobacter sp. S3L5C]
MKTADALFQQYGKKFVSAEIVITEFWGYPCEAFGDITKLIGGNKLNGLKPFRAGKKYIVDVEQLAGVLDSIK